MFLHIGTERHPPEPVCSHPSSQAEHAPSVVRGDACHAEIRPVEGGRPQRRRAILAADLGTQRWSAWTSRERLTGRGRRTKSGTAFRAPEGICPRGRCKKGVSPPGPAAP